MVHIISGPPCAGKSTYWLEHVPGNVLVIDYDYIAEALGGYNDHDVKGLIREAAFSARTAAIETALADPNQESWIVDTFLTEESRKRYIAAGAELIELDPGKEECLERARRTGRPDSTFEGIEKWYAGKKGVNKMLYKSFEVKADEGTGSISGYFATYDRIPDSYGDIIAPGAFTDTIKAREETGHPFPLCWNHDLDQIIGKVDKIEDTEKGPLFAASFFDTPLAQEKREIVKSGTVYQFSFAYNVLDNAPVELEGGEKANELRKLDLFEISIVPIPANPRAEMTEIKSDEPDVKSGRRNSKKDADAIRQAITLLQGVLGELEEAEDPEDGEDEAKANTAVEEPESSNPVKEKLLEYIKNMEV